MPNLIGVKLAYLAVMCLAACAAFAQAPLLLPTRNLAEELALGTNLGWRGMYLMGVAYQPVDETWLKNDFMPKFDKVVKRLRMKSHTEAFDCDNFAELFKSELQVENRLAGNSALGEVACGILVVEQNKSFGRVPAGRDLHSLILVRTQSGWQVIEPQTLRVAALEKYPNRQSIESVYF